MRRSSSSMPLHKADRVGQEELLATGQARATRRRIKRGEEPVLRQHTGTGQRVQQRGLARVGVADQRDHRRARALAPFAVQLAVGAHMFQFLDELFLLPAQQTPVDLDLLFALTALLHAALLPLIF